MNIAQKTLLAAALAAGFSVAVQAQERVYVTDTRDVVTTSGADLCWRTGFWTPAAAAADPAGCECDRDLLPREACEAGAARPTARPTADKISVAADALFDFDKATLRPEGKAKLDELVAQARSINLEVILAVGHTDRLGSAAYNQRLSERRAAAVRNYLVSQGIEADRVYTEGKGASQSVTGNSCTQTSRRALIDCLQPDRRVDIEVIGTR